jgi:hypothetical protein
MQEVADELLEHVIQEKLALLQGVHCPPLKNVVLAH